MPDWNAILNSGVGELLPMGELFLRLAMATILGGLVGLERERLDRAAGLRTHALVCVASALIMVVSTYGFPIPPGRDATGFGMDPSRIAAQVVSGIGFLGAGVIIFRGGTIRGLTTAATLWSVAGVGLAAGGGLYLAAIAGTVFMLLIQAGLKPLERRMFPRHARQHRVLVETRRDIDALADLRSVLQGSKVRLRSMEFDYSEDSDRDLIELTLLAQNQSDILDVLGLMQRSAGITRVHYRRGSSMIQAQERLGMSVEGDDPDEEDEETER